MVYTNRRQPTGIFTSVCALVLSISLIILAFCFVAPSSAGSDGTQSSKNLPQVSPTQPTGCELGWSIVNSPNAGERNTLNDVVAISADDAWAVGSYVYTSTHERALLEHWDGTQWNVVVAPAFDFIDSALNTVTALREDDVWVAGVYSPDSGPERPLFGHWDGTGWAVVPSPDMAGRIMAMDAISSDDIWAVGWRPSGGQQTLTLVEHWDGVEWSVIATPNTTYRRNDLWAVAAVSEDDVWAVGKIEDAIQGSRPLIEHWDGVQWSIVPSPVVGPEYSRLYDVTALSADDVWAVGYYTLQNNTVHRTLIEHWDGVQWSVVPSPDPDASLRELFAVEAISADDIWAVGMAYQGRLTALIEHWDGTEWQIVGYPGPGTLQTTLEAIAFTSEQDVWAVGLRADAYIPPTPNIPPTPSNHTQLDQTFTMRFGQCDPLSPTPSTTTTALPPTSTGTPNPLATWTRTPTGTRTSSPTSTQSASATSTLTPGPTAPPPSTTPTVPPGCVLDWIVVDSLHPGMASGRFYAVSAFSANDVWAVGNYSQPSAPDVTRTLVEHWNGSEWSIVPSPNPSAQSNTLHGVDAMAPDNVWAVGDYAVSSQLYPLLMHWDGSAWSTIPIPVSVFRRSLDDVEVLSPDNVWAVGIEERNGVTYPLIIHWDGTQSTIVLSPFAGSGRLRAIHAVSSNDIWTVGASYPSSLPRSSLIMHWDGSEWTVVPSPPWANGVRELLDIAAVSASDIWAVGYTSSSEPKSPRGLTLHWDGISWEDVANPFPVSASAEYLLGVSALSANDVWAVGAADNYSNPPNSIITAMHWGGTSWNREFIPLPATSNSVLFAVDVVSRDDVWAVGYTHDIGSPSKSLAEHYTYTCSTPSPTETGTPVPATSTTTPTEVPVSTSTTTTTATTPSSTATKTPTPSSTVTVAATLTSTRTAQVTPSHTGTSTATISDWTVTSTPGMATATTTTTSLASTPTLAPCSVEFTDVPTSNTFYAQISCLACRNIMGGYSDDTFRPNNNITRGQLSKIVANSAGFNEPVSGQAFEDVEAGSTFYEYIERMASRGIIGGYPCGSTGEPCVGGNRPYFRPNANATRGQISKIVSEAKSYDHLPTAQTFEDVLATSAFYLWIERLASRSIMGGYACGSTGEPCGTANRPYFRPGNNATRGQTSKIVANTFFPGCQTLSRR